mgnify:CR=1 FL=1
MRGYQLKIVLGGLIACALCNRAAAQQQFTADKVIAVVGNSMVLYSDLERLTQSLIDQQKETGYTSGRDPRCEALEHLIVQKVLYNQSQIDSIKIYNERIIDQKVQDRLKKVRAKREKAKNQGVKERIEEDTRGLVRENKELADQMKTLFKANHVPGFCRGSYYYALYFTRTFKDFLALLMTIMICFLAIPCGAYFLIPERRTMYLVGIYVAAILIFGGIYVTIGNMTKVRYMEVLKEGLGIRAKIRANKKEMKVIAKTIRRDKNETVYNLQKFDDEIAQLDQDAAEINRKKKEALTTFDTVTRTIISDEITANNKEEINRMGDELSSLAEKLRSARTAAKEKALFITDHYEVYIGKEYMTPEKLAALADIVRSGAASNISDAISVYKSQGDTAK